ncbi:MAG: 3-dehydroquinate synthase, partial [Actinobacteria bacterium]|nr:3-dehydroquinate synthase [Actinomycetota bacterium]
MSLETVVVNLGERSYPVVVGHRAIASLADLIGPAVQRCAVVTQEGIPSDSSLPIESQRFVIERGEKAKTLATIDSLSQGFAEMGL